MPDQCENCRSPLEDGVVRCSSCGHRKVVDMDPNVAQDYLEKARKIKEKYEDTKK